MNAVNTLINKITPCLCPPGYGVHTVHTARERKEALLSRLYPGRTDVRQAWQESLTHLQDETLPLVTGICCDTGGGILRGANWGPLFIRNALAVQPDLPGYLDAGDVRVIPHFHHDKYLNERTKAGCRYALYGDENSTLPVSALSMAEYVLNAVYRQYPGRRILGLGGDHSVSYPLLSTYLKARKTAGKKVSIIHFDAHTDLMPERLGVDLCFGSWCAHILPHLSSPAHLIQLGVRSSGKDKTHWERTTGVQQYWAREIVTRGAQEIAGEIAAFLTQEGSQELYVSFDIDALDADIASATGTPEPDGLSEATALTILQHLSKRFAITGADVVEVAPFVCTDESGTAGSKRTVAAATRITTFLLNALHAGV